MQFVVIGLLIYSILYKGGLIVSYDVDIWGVNCSVVNVVGVSFEVQKVVVVVVNLSVVSLVVVGYVMLLLLDEQLWVIQQMLILREDVWCLVKCQFEIGYILCFELMQVDLELWLMWVQILLLQYQIVQQENVFSVLFGDNSGVVKCGEFVQFILLCLLLQLLFILFNCCLDIVQVECQLVVVDVMLVLLQVQLLFFINLIVIGSLQDWMLLDLLDNLLWLWSFGGSILVLLLNCQVLNVQVDVFMVQCNQVFYSYEKMVCSVFKEVNDSLDVISCYGEQLIEFQE